MPSWVWLVIAAMVVVAVMVLVVALAVGRRRRTERLKARFGPEYERTVTAAGGQGAAERELAERERRHGELDIVPLTPAALDAHNDRWRTVQTGFVDDPSRALGDADLLVTVVMRERGYPVDDFDRRAADISVEHPGIVENYRAAHAISMAQRPDSVDTERQRQAFVHYRALFEALLSPDPEHATTTHTAPNHVKTAQEASAS